jgi:hypothetical protein
MPGWTRSASWRTSSLGPQKIESSEDALRNSIALFDRLVARVAPKLGFRDEVTASASAEVERILAKRLEP